MVTLIMEQLYQTMERLRVIALTKELVVHCLSFTCASAVMNCHSASTTAAFLVRSQALTSRYNVAISNIQ